MKGWVASVVLLLAVVVGACAPASGGSATTRTTAGSQRFNPPPPPLATAIHSATHLGAAGAGTEVSINFGLKTRDAGGLAALLASGRTITPAEYAAEFGADPVLIQHALSALNDSGLRATWRTGSSLIEADGPAPAASALLGIAIENYRLPDGTTFYAAVDQPRLPPQLAAVVASVAGLDSYRRLQSQAVSPGGLKPADVLAFYNLKALRDRGLDGTGETILFPEIGALPNSNIDDMNRFATEFGLPAFDAQILQVKHDPSWGNPTSDGAIEVVLDLEIAHEVAPKAKLVAYLAGPQPAGLARAFDQMVTDHLGSIISESLGICEPATSSGYRDLYGGIQDRATAQGMTHFVASGDHGAYECGQDSGPTTSFPATMPTVTAVGGTTVFESTQGTYFKEAVWGAPISGHGTGGGSSQFYALPDWQKPVQDANGHGFRQEPDVAADADPITGFHYVFGGQESQVGGTSAATPLWAATAALINQDLKSKKLREIGFANPAIYWMGENQSKLPAKPFHDVTTGNNLAYNAGPGWDFATGWGSMDGVALDQAWILYIKGGGA